MALEAAHVLGTEAALAELRPSHRLIPCPPTLLDPPQLDGIAAAQEQDDNSSVFGLAGRLLDSALDADPSLLEDDAHPAGPAVAPAAGHASVAVPATDYSEAMAQPVGAPAAEGLPAGKLEPTGIRSKYDPITALLSWAATAAPQQPTSAARQQQPRYDPVAELHAAATAAAPAHGQPKHGHQHHPRPKYCLVHDLLAWALHGWAANSEREQPAERTAAYSS